MNAAIIIDIVLVAILAIFVIRGASRGLVLTLCGLLAVVVAFFGARFVADLGAPRVAEYLEPRFAAAIEEQLRDQMETTRQAPAPAEGAPEQLPLQDVLDVLKGMGLYEDLVATIEKAVDQGMAEVAAGAAAAIASSVAYMLLFVAAFALLLLLWTILSHALDLVSRLPVLNTLNHAGGALLGLVKGCLILFLCAWVLRYSGTLMPEETVAQTRLLSFFLNTNPLSLFLGS